MISTWLEEPDEHRSFWTRARLAGEGGRGFRLCATARGIVSTSQEETTGAARTRRQRTISNRTRSATHKSNLDRS